tara:strand:+ start:1174 stop:1338 length:165 start_codon:yes stop_codon:yes gene_type:complete
MNSTLKSSLFVAAAGAAAIYFMADGKFHDTKTAATFSAIITGGGFYAAKMLKVI